MNIFILLLLITKIYQVTNLPSQITATKLILPDATQTNPIDINSIQGLSRKKKGPNLPYQYQIQQLYVQNLHVIPLDNNTTHTNLIPILIPVHRLVPVHDLTVIPLSHRVSEKVYRMNNEAELYRNPLGGYGVGWRFGGHGAGHGFHYAYG